VWPLKDPNSFSDATYHPSLHLYRLDAKFRFSTSGLDGDCIISFGFPEYSSASNTESEIELKIKKINFEHIGKGMDKNDAKETNSFALLGSFCHLESTPSCNR
jgi:hypothetical protein